MYVIHKTDGTIAAAIQDGAADNSTDLTLVGRNYLNYGSVVMQDLVHLLENFASSVPPTKPTIGEIWYDSGNHKLMAFNGTIFKAVNAVMVSSSQPSLPQDGDFWYDSLAQQLKFWAQQQWNVIAPVSTAAQGKSGVYVQTIKDNTSHQYDHTVTEIWNNNEMIAIIATEEFTPLIAISGFSDLLIGINLPDYTVMNATAANSRLLAGLDNTHYMRTDQDTATTGNLVIQNDGGVTIGNTGGLTINIGDNGPEITSVADNATLTLFTHNSTDGKVPAVSFTGEGEATFTHNVHALNYATAGNISITKDASISGNATVGQAFTVSGDTMLANLAANFATFADDIAVSGNANVSVSINVPNIYASELRLGSGGQSFPGVASFAGNIGLLENSNITFYHAADGTLPISSITSGYTNTNKPQIKLFAGASTTPAAIFTDTYTQIAIEMRTPNATVQGQISVGNILMNETTISANNFQPNLVLRASNINVNGNLRISADITAASNVTASHADFATATIGTFTATNTAASQANFVNVKTTNTSANVATLGVQTGDKMPVDYSAVLIANGNVVISSGSNIQWIGTSLSYGSRIVGSQNQLELKGNAWTGAGALVLDDQGNNTLSGNLTIQSALNAGNVSFDKITVPYITSSSDIHITPTGNTIFSNIISDSVTTLNANVHSGIDVSTGMTQGSLRVFGGAAISQGLNVLGNANLSGATFNTPGIMSTASNTVIYGNLSVTGDITAYYSSDSRLKGNISVLSDAAAKLNRLQGVEFDWSEELMESKDRRHDVGVIAQQVRDVLPEAVVERANGYLAVSYEKIIPLLIEAVKDLQRQVKELQDKR
jgi:hypothetical protein